MNPSRPATARRRAAAAGAGDLPPDAGVGPRPADPLPTGHALQSEPGHLIRRAHQIAVSVFHDVHGRQVTPVQYAVLMALHDTPGIDQVTLADKVALDTSTTADIATRLEAKGWVERALLARRQRSLTLTDEGRAVIAAMRPHVAPMHERLLAPLDAAEQAELLRLLRKLVGLG